MHSPALVEKSGEPYGVLTPEIHYYCLRGHESSDSVMCPQGHPVAFEQAIYPVGELPCHSPAR